MSEMCVYVYSLYIFCDAGDWLNPGPQWHIVNDSFTPISGPIGPESLEWGFYCVYLGYLTRKQDKWTVGILEIAQIKSLVKSLLANMRTSGEFSEPLDKSLEWCWVLGICWRGRDRWIPGTRWPASLACKPISKNRCFNSNKVLGTPWAKDQKWVMFEVPFSWAWVELYGPGQQWEW